VWLFGLERAGIAFAHRLLRHRHLVVRAQRAVGDPIAGEVREAAPIQALSLRSSRRSPRQPARSPVACVELDDDFARLVRCCLPSTR
jgi:hypothetical protein